MNNSKHISIRPYQLKDAEQYALARIDPNITIPYLHTIYEPSKKNDFINSFSTCPEYIEPNAFAIALNKSDLFIGATGIHDYSSSNKKANFFYYLISEYWGKGIAYKATSMVIKNIFNKILIDQLDAKVLNSNERSIKLLKKLGFKKLSGLNEPVTINGKPEYQTLYVLLNNQ
ncbi:MAG: hypothetical protein COA79_21055 [Planctomycetota bacterium]|nr:MAG: hypothetical protein COA79_21055 [Planctomycetota bacterium]